MAKILGVGIATLDIINTVSEFPAEDAEVRAIKQNICRGGNVTNSLVLLSQLGHQCYWHGTLATDSSASLILEDLNNFEINCKHVAQIKNSATPTSYITLNQKNGSRTIVHYRHLDELSFSAFKNISLNEFDWIHFEARNIEQTVKMLIFLKQKHPDIPCSVECEKNRYGIEQLYSLPDLLIFSRNFCLQNNFTSAEDFLMQFTTSNKTQEIVVAWSEQGAYTRTKTGDINQIEAITVKNIIDTIGAGDAFNAGLIDGLLSGHTINKACSVANQLAAHKISQTGFNIATFQR